ncbi:hypothetical protein ABZW30_09815 [Kitasatospora sp. NPDC004669]
MGVNRPGAGPPGSPEKYEDGQYPSGPARACLDAARRQDAARGGRGG